MAYKWLPVTEDFDKSLVIKKWRFDVSCPISGNYDGALSELPNIDIKTCWNNSRPENGYAFSNRFNLGQKYFSNRYYGFTDGRWTATASSHTTFVSGTTYEFECPVDLYWAGNYSTPWNSNIPNYMWFYVNTSTFETDITAITATYNSTTCAVTLTADEDMAWTASTSNDWITLSTTGGTGSSVFTVSVAANKAYAARNGLVTLTNGTDMIEITVEQAKYPLLIPNENIYRADLEVVKGYRSGSTINKAYRSGELIYYRLEVSEPEPIYEEMYLTFEVISAGTIVWRKAGRNAPSLTIQYSINSGSWQSITANDTAGTAINVAVGDVVRFKGINTSYASSNSYVTACRFAGTAKYYAYGNIMSLIYGDHFIGETTLTANYTFTGLLLNAAGLTSAENLILPATTLTNDCYHHMFFGCTNIERAPELPAPTLANYSYSEMFGSCSKLAYIKCLATNISASNCTSNWVNGVASTGTFVTPSSTNWSTGTSGIPTNWTRVEA